MHGAGSRAKFEQILDLIVGLVDRAGATRFVGAFAAELERNFGKRFFLVMDGCRARFHIFGRVGFHSSHNPSSDSVEYGLAADIGRLGRVRFHTLHVYRRRLAGIKQRSLQAISNQQVALAIYPSPRALARRYGRLNAPARGSWRFLVRHRCTWSPGPRWRRDRACCESASWRFARHLPPADDRWQWRRRAR